MKDSFGQQGWKEFHRNRKNILEEYQRLLDLTENRPVQVAHGQGVEAYIRNWLGEFLPRKYGVTSGYIIPSLYNDSGIIYHFDIIIYNRLDAPVLWTEGNTDTSEQGKYRAIPAKHVVAVYEVKSRFTKGNVVEALEKLGQINQFKAQLPSNYSCGVIFVELKESDNGSKVILEALHPGKDVHGFVGGVILRYENDESATGRILLLPNGEEQPEGKQLHSPLAKKIDDLNIFQTEDGNVVIAEPGGGVAIMATSEKTLAVSKMYGPAFTVGGVTVDLSWAHSNFAQFCIDLLSRLEGLPFNNDQRPSFGMIFDSLRQEKAPPQPQEPKPNYPFLSLRLHAGGPDAESHTLDIVGDKLSVTYWIEITNEGTDVTTISDDRFRSSTKLPPKARAITQLDIQVSPKKDGLSMKELLDGEGLELPYRLVYKAGAEGKELFSLEKTILVKTGSVSMNDSHVQTAAS